MGVGRGRGEGEEGRDEGTRGTQVPAVSFTTEVDLRLWKGICNVSFVTHIYTSLFFSLSPLTGCNLTHMFSGSRSDDKQCTHQPVFPSTPSQGHTHHHNSHLVRGRGGEGEWDMDMEEGGGGERKERYNYDAPWPPTG